MQIEFPKVEYILNNKQEKLTDEQKLWLQLVCLRESILNMAIKNFMGLEKDNCQTMYLSFGERRVNICLSSNSQSRSLAAAMRCASASKALNFSRAAYSKQAIPNTFSVPLLSPFSCPPPCR